MNCELKATLLHDAPTVFQVLLQLTDAAGVVTLTCVSRAHALKLRPQLERCTWASAQMGPPP